METFVELVAEWSHMTTEILVKINSGDGLSLAWH